MHLSITEIISWCVFGLIVGLIARFLLPGRQHMGLVMTMILGIAGSFAGGFIGSIFSRRDHVAMHPSGWMMSIVGALVVLFMYSKFARPRI
jgi:uncharacterized membrane protein YeaQ/YmgE (transglycosylase-associated protein family)